MRSSEWSPQTHLRRHAVGQNYRRSEQERNVPTQTYCFDGIAVVPCRHIYKVKHTRAEKKQLRRNKFVLHKCHRVRPNRCTLANTLTTRVNSNASHQKYNPCSTAIYLPSWYCFGDGTIYERFTIRFRPPQPHPPHLPTLLFKRPTYNRNRA